MIVVNQSKFLNGSDNPINWAYSVSSWPCVVFGRKLNLDDMGKRLH